MALDRIGMDGLVVSQSRIVVAQARIAQVKTATHGSGATPRPARLSASFTVVDCARYLPILNN
jgi:hypothetical protein